MATRTAKVNAEATAILVRLAASTLESAMQEKPGPYPDPDCPIHKWQEAHAHLLAARTLLEM